MSMPAFARRVIDLEKKMEIVEAWRYMRIGGVVDVTAPDLPLENCMWADGSLVLFDLWPELKAKYEKGGFSGLLLPYNCSDEDKKTYPLKWVHDSANPTGLFVPRLIGLFARYCAKNNAGKHNAAGLPNMTGRAAGFQMTATDGALSFVAGGNNPVYNIESVVEMYNLSVDASRSNPIFGLSDTVMPESYDTPIALYLGRPAEI